MNVLIRYSGQPTSKAEIITKTKVVGLVNAFVDELDKAQFDHVRRKKVLDTTIHATSSGAYMIYVRGALAMWLIRLKTSGISIELESIIPTPDDAFEIMKIMTPELTNHRSAHYNDWIKQHRTRIVEINTVDWLTVKWKDVVYV